MARGFESKSVQSQWQDAEEREAQRLRPKKSTEELEREQKRASLQVQRARVTHDLAKTSSDAYQRTLRAALAHLDAELAKLE